MSSARKAAAAVAVLRVAYGAALVAAPARTTRGWLGPDARRPAAGIAIRALGAREIGIHAGALVAALNGGALRPWFAASIAGDCSDIAATLAAGSALPDRAPAATAAVAGASAAISAAVALAVDA